MCLAWLGAGKEQSVLLLVAGRHWSKYFFHKDPRVHCLPPEIRRNWQYDSGALGLSKLCIGWNNFLVLTELLFISSAAIVIQAKLELSCCFSVYFGSMLLRCP